jgi:hypothetical protein
MFRAESECDSFDAFDRSRIAEGKLGEMAAAQQIAIARIEQQKRWYWLNAASDDRFCECCLKRTRRLPAVIGDGHLGQLL